MKASRVLAFIVVLFVFPATVWAQQVFHGCVKNNNGQLRIVAATEQCLPSEHAVEWISGAGAGSTIVPPPVVPPPTTPPPPGALRVLDSREALVGMLASSGVVGKQIGDLWIGIPVSTSGFQVNDVLFTYYQNENCAGDAYLALDPMSVLRMGVVMRSSPSQLTLSYPGIPDVSNTTIVSYGMMSAGVFTCFGSYSQVSYVPTFGKAATLNLSSLVAPFKVVQ